MEARFSFDSIGFAALRVAAVRQDAVVPEAPESAWRS
jgi:hypothetical protein